MGLTIGGADMPKNWGFPSPIFNYKRGRYEVGGMVWHGRKRTRKENKDALRNQFGPNVKIDGPSTRGTQDPKYSTYRQRKMDKPDYQQHLVVS